MAKKRKTTFESFSDSDTSSAATPDSGPASKANLSRALDKDDDEDFKESAEEYLKTALLDWLKLQPFYKKKSADVKKTQENAIRGLADGLISVMKETPDSHDRDSILLQEIKKHTQKFSEDSKNKTNDELPTQILEHLKCLNIFQEITNRQDQPPVLKEVKKKATVTLLEDIANWIQKLPIETGSSEDIENTKEQLESKIVHKIGELNMNSEIFNDDFMYDDILGDEIENLLSNLPDEDIKNNLNTLKRELLAITKKARKKIRDENAGQIYKKQLCEAISNVLPSFNLDVEGKASFEVLKDDVADAFISMCYVGNDEEEKNRLRKKINDAIYRFCNKYLKRCPASPFDTTKINKALYCALKCITEPQNESFTDDIELVKIKDQINKWLEELPLKNHAGQEKLHTNRLISVLAKNIHDIENEKEFISSDEYEEKMNKEIDKFLKKIPLTTENDDDLSELSEQITTALKDTEECRKLNASTRHYNQPLGNKCSKAKLRISFNDVSVSPCPVDTCNQTSSFSKICSVPNECLEQKSSSAQTPCKRMKAVGSQVNMTPKVIVNEYNWDSIDESGMQSPRVACPCPSDFHPPYAAMPQPLQCSGTGTRADESYMESFQPSSSASAVRPPCTVMPRRHPSPATQREHDNSTATMKSCLTTRPFPLQPFENKFIKPRDPEQMNACKCPHYQTGISTPSSVPAYNYDDYDDQLPENSGQYETEAGRQYSDQSVRSAEDENNSCPRINQQSTPRKYLPTSGQGPPYPYHLSTAPAPERQSMSQRNCQHSQSNQYSKQPYNCSIPCDGTGQRNELESQYIPHSPCPGTQQTRSQQHQDSQPITSSPYMNSCSPYFSQGPSRITPRSPMAYSPSSQMPCASSPRSPCYLRRDSQPSEDYDPGFDCSLDYEYWDSDRPNFESVDQNNRKGKCKVCKRSRRFGEFSGKRY